MNNQALSYSILIKYEEISILDIAYLTICVLHSFIVPFFLVNIASNMSNPMYLLNLKAGAAFLPLEIYQFALSLNVEKATGLLFLNSFFECLLYF